MPSTLAQPRTNTGSKPFPSVVVWHVASVRGGPWLQIESPSYEAAAMKAAEIMGCCVEETIVRYVITRGGSQ